MNGLDLTAGEALADIKQRLIALETSQRLLNSRIDTLSARVKQLNREPAIEAAE